MLKSLSVVAALTGLVACAPDYYPMRTPMRPVAVANKDYAAAVRLDKQVLGQGAGLTPTQRQEVETNLHDDVRAFVQSKLAEIPPLEPKTARAVVQALGVLRADILAILDEPEATALVNEVVTARSDAALELVWTAEGEGAASPWTAMRVAAGFAKVLPDGRYPALYETAKQRVLAIHTEAAQAAGSQYPGAAYVHAQLVAFAGGPAATFPESTKAETSFPRSVEVTGRACGQIEALRMTPASSIGHPIRIEIDVQNCIVGIENKGSITVGRTYTQTEQVKVPIETWDSNCHTEYGTPTAVDTQDKYGNKGTGFVRSSGEVCGTPTKGFHGEYEIEDQEVEHIENVEIESRQHVGAANGYFTATFDNGEVVKGSFEVRETSSLDEQYSSQHAGSKRFDDAAHRAEAENALNNAISSKIGEATRSTIGGYARAWFDRGTAAADAGNAAEAEHNYFVAGMIAGYFDPLDRWLEKRYAVPAEILVSMRHSSTLEPIALDLSSDASVSTTWGTGEEDAWIRREIEESVSLADHLVISLAGGYVSSSETASGGNSSSGGVAQFGISSLLKIPESHFVAGFIVRAALGKVGPGLVEADMNVSGGIAIKHFSIAPLLGFGTDRTLGYDAAMPDADNFELPPAGFSQYGLRAEYLFHVIPLHLEAIYTKAFRGSDTSVDVAKRLELRAGWRPFGVVVRYSEYDENNNDSFFSAFGGTTRVGKSLWILGGLVY